jgi:hypothetical protein
MAPNVSIFWEIVCGQTLFSVDESGTEMPLVIICGHYHSFHPFNGIDCINETTFASSSSIANRTPRVRDRSQFSAGS